MLQSKIPDRSHLMSVLWDIQRKKRCIEPEDITKISQVFDISKTELEGVISFYHFYHFKDVGKYTIYLNSSIVSEYSGRDEIRQAFEDAIGIGMGKVTSDKMFGLFDTPCIGLSDQEPACLINFKPFTHLNRQKVFDIINQIKLGKNPSEICDIPKSKIQYTPTPDRTVFFKPYTLFTALKKLEEYPPEQIIDMVKQSKLAGRGGAFFPTGLKWQFCRQYESDIKYIVCNADEGEPGTFKDRVLLQEHPELVIEGMIFAAYAVGASQGAIYLRAEYMYLKEGLENLLDKYRAQGYLGNNIPAMQPFDFDIYVHLGAGAYVCGEETALLNSMEGKRGEPGTKEYFPVQKGYKGKPTVVNNVETLATVPRIFEMGVESWLKLGTTKTPGTKLLSVSGDCPNKGIYEIEWGMKFSDFLKLTGVEKPKIVQFSGPSGDCLSISPNESKTLRSSPRKSRDFLADNEYDRVISGEDITCGGSVMIFNETRDVLHIIKSFSDFFVAESCGICVPCRTGNFLLNKKLQKIINGHGEKKDLEDIKSWSNIIRTSSRCGLGQMSNNSLLQAIAKFPDVFDKALDENSDYNPAFNMETATAEYDRIIKEINANYE
jgi:[NiFe] hydrogenase diaphorase moiety large subunit